MTGKEIGQCLSRWSGRNDDVPSRPPLHPSISLKPATQNISQSHRRNGKPKWAWGADDFHGFRRELFHANGHKHDDGVRRIGVATADATFGENPFSSNQFHPSRNFFDSAFQTFSGSNEEDRDRHRGGCRGVDQINSKVFAQNCLIFNSATSPNEPSKPYRAAIALS
jgi:hypothetical protein